MNPALSVRSAVLAGSLATVMLVFGFGVWATATTINGAVVAQGRLEVDRDRQIVQHPEGGVVLDILVQEGDAVTAGQPLLRLDAAGLQSELRIIDGQLSELACRMARLVAERDGRAEPAFPDNVRVRARSTLDVAAQMDGQRQLFLARAASLAARKGLLNLRIGQLSAQIDGLSAQEAALIRQVELVGDELSQRQELLGKGLVQAGSVLALEREAARLQGQLGEVRAGLARARDEITEIGLESASLDTRRREEATSEIRQIAPVILELEERRRALSDRVNAMVLRAPVAGVVFGLQVTTPGSVLRPAEPALYVLPKDRPLVVAAQISPIDIDEIFPGQTAELVFSAFSSRSTPHLAGRVVRISPDAVADSQSGAAFYAVELDLGPGERARLGDAELVPGMPVEVYLQTGGRSPMAYLVKPLADLFAHAFRES